jgi:hypothetical protein
VTALIGVLIFLTLEHKQPKDFTSDILTLQQKSSTFSIQIATDQKHLEAVERDLKQFLDARIDGERTESFN